MALPPTRSSGNSVEVSSIFDYNSWTDYAATAVLAVIAALTLYGAYQIVFVKGFRQQLFDEFSSLLRKFYGLEVALQPSGSSLAEEIRRLRADLVDRNAALSVEAEAQVVEQFKLALEGALSSEIAEALQSYLDLQAAEATDRRSLEGFDKIADRLAAAQSAVSLRGAVSLTFAIISALGALFYLKDIGDDFSPQYIDGLTYQAILYLSIMRISVAIFITFISYYFLSLYRRSLDEIKFYQSELTNIEVWKMTLMASFATEQQTVTSEVLRSLVTVDRNLDAGVTSTSSKSTTKTAIDSDTLKTILGKIPG